MTKHQQTRNGFSLIELLVAIGISTILMLAFVASMNFQASGIHHINQALSVIESEKLISAAISSSDVCKYAFSGQGFNANIVSASAPQKVTAKTPIYSWYKSTPTVVTGPVIAQTGKPLSPEFPELVPQSIQLQITGKPTPLTASASTGGFTANIVVNFAPQKFGSLKPISIPVLVNADTTTPGSAKVSDCTINSGNAGIGVGQTWQDLTASRSALTAYTNNTGRPIQVAITVTVANSRAASIIVDNTTVGYADAWLPSGIHVRSQLNAIVPPGSWYAMGSLGGATPLIWEELR